MYIVSSLMKTQQCKALCISHVVMGRADCVTDAGKVLPERSDQTQTNTYHIC